MSESIPVMRLSTEAMDALRSVAQQSPQLWQNPDTNFHNILTSLNITDYAEPTGLVADGPIAMPSAAQFGSTSRAQADRAALAFRDNIPGISPAQMADPQILAWVSCFHLLGFGIERWPVREGSEPTPQHVIMHYLPERGRDITDASVAGRTLWLSEICKRVSESSASITAEQVLDNFCNNPENYHNCTAFYVLRSPLVLSEYVWALLGDAKGINREGSREIARDINRAAGARLVDSLSRQDIRTVIATSVDRLMRQSKYVADRTKIRGRQNVQVLSLGAGVQSTVMALMAEENYDGMPTPELAIFADTGWEPKAVYEHLNWLETQLSYPVVRVSAGNIRDNILSGTNPEGRPFIDMPVYVVKNDGKHYIGTRQCTKLYKLHPIEKYLRQYLELEYGKVAPKEKQVDMWLGLSIDEAIRVKPSRHPWITNIYPLLEKEFSRKQLYAWFKERYPERDLPKSACIGCPYHTDRTWAEMKENDPESFQDAVNVEWAIQNVPQSKGALDGTAYLHKSRVPLREVEFNFEMTEAEAMQQECEGMCGI